jgi:hypothetical protein
MSIEAASNFHLIQNLEPKVTHRYNGSIVSIYIYIYIYILRKQFEGD